MKKALAILLVLALVMIPLAACNDTTTPDNNSPPPANSPDNKPADSPDNSSGGNTGGDTGNQPATPGDKPIGDGLKAAMILAGPISDPGFNGPAYEGLVRMKDELGYEISYAESVAPADYENVFRTYAQQGYDIIFAHGAQFLETAILVGDEFPDTWFAVSSGFGSNGVNVSGWNLNTYDVGFLAGALMAQMTTTKQIGMVSGPEIPPIIMMYESMIAGAAYIDPEVVVQNVFTGDHVDSAQCREAAIALLDSGCDILSSTAGVGSPGAIAACAERGFYFVGTSADWSPVDPTTVLNSVFTDWGGAALLTAELFAKGEIVPMPYMNGIAEGAVYFTGWGELESVVPESVKASINDIMEGVASGSIDIGALVAALSS